MRRRIPARSSVWTAFAFCLPTLVIRAAAADEDAEHDGLLLGPAEDSEDGEARAEDVVPAPPRRGSPPLHVGLSLGMGSRVGGLPKASAFVLGTVTVPLDQAVDRGAAPPSSNSPSPFRLVRRASGREAARGAVAAAFRVAGLDSDALLERLATRARLSGLVPEARGRVLRRTGTADGLAIAASGLASAREQLTDDLWIEGRLSWRFDRLLFAPEEVGLARLRAVRADARTRLAREVLAALSAWRRAEAERQLVPPESPERVDADLRLEEADAQLEILTGGWFAAHASP